ncbi:NACHT domain-containing protein [Lysinibacillus fusiformis]|uniref:NACHT domain-containing protein n=1 Tax=Lysinibacillus fusiformis TaxID=28031 RepID=UPI0008911D81|nr:NACHT domain-containing protein [Lysinibacillus fusiformis]SCX63420.1 NACHT domain-containing protein [Lysinibacillus fusiformis]SDB46233.1 NACHT domain-containing protein [Lysinibacillus fusiformis]SFI72965.1 NACHT domain-containing protein [Lysinibacillus fusiformis]SFT15706.1 NACHT domain-containing protein [Lysinibacillus fusiformis]
MKQQELKKLIAIVKTPGEQGTAFIIDRGRALTAGHVVNHLENGQEVELYFVTLNVKRKAYVIKCPDVDLALLTLDTPIEDSINLEFPLLYAYKFDGDDKVYSSFGYPEWKKLDGQTLGGKITNTIDHPKPNDLELSCSELNNKDDMDGISGSPLIIENGIHGLIVTIDHLNNPGAISLQRCIPFLEEFKIPFEVTSPLLPFEEAILSSGEKLGRIGYEEGEDLPFQETMASWRTLTHNIRYEDIYDTNPQRLVDLIDEYYRMPNIESFSHDIFFVVADFGKGKSTFLKHYTAELAEKYRVERTGFIPVYFNLRDFNDHHPTDNDYGCIGSYLNQLCKYDVVNDPVIRERKFMFLIDSLDESGGLDHQHVQTVMHSVRKISKLEEQNFAKNRLIVASRPISGVLEEIIAKNMHYEDSQGRRQFASIFGFTPKQRDNYFYQLREHLELENAPKFNQDLIRHIKQNDSIANLLNDVITEDEWRRPILAYMIFKLLQQHKEIQQGHRVGVYLSFINLLTKEAKHIGSKEMDTNVLTEITHRNLLYATSIMWLRNKSTSGENHLKIQDIVDIWGIPNAKNYRFLSHTYLEIQQDKYFFNHQSFAEMLLAEYYLRVFLHAAFQPNVQLNQIREMLLIGEPTQQVMSFYKGLIDLLIESIEESTLTDFNLLERRKMLFPIVASLGLSRERHKMVSNLDMDSYLYCEEIDSFFNMDELQSYKSLADSHVQRWPITKQILERITQLCQAIIGSDTEYTPFTVKPVNNVPYINVGKVSENRLWQTHHLDRWIALLTGERCNSYISDSESFLDVKTSKNVMTMLWNNGLTTNNAHPFWIDSISGLNISDNRNTMTGLSFQSIDIIDMKSPNFNLNLIGSDIEDTRIFLANCPSINGNGLRIRDSYLSHVAFPKSMMKGIELLGSSLDNVNFYGTIMNGTKIHECILNRVNLERVELYGSDITANYFIKIISMKDIKLGSSRMWNWIDKDSYERCEEDIRKIRNHRFKIISMDQAEDVIGRRLIKLQEDSETYNKLLKQDQYFEINPPLKYDIRQYDI